LLQNLTDQHGDPVVVASRGSLEEAMQVPHASPPQPSLVTVIFRDTALFFMMPAGATMGELADYLADLGEAHGGDPVAVDVQLVC
jgi:hypothetical protein